MLVTTKHVSKHVYTGNTVAKGAFPFIVFRDLNELFLCPEIAYYKRGEFLVTRLYRKRQQQNGKTSRVKFPHYNHIVQHGIQPLLCSFTIYKAHKTRNVTGRTFVSGVFARCLAFTIKKKGPRKSSRLLQKHPRKSRVLDDFK